jgi:hypothetical protein
LGLMASPTNNAGLWMGRKKDSTPRSPRSPRRVRGFFGVELALLSGEGHATAVNSSGETDIAC